MGGLDALCGLYEARRLDEAWAEYERLLSVGPVTPDDHLWGGMSAWRRGDLHDARTAFERGLSTRPTGCTLGRLLLSYGVTLREIGEYTTAIDRLQEFLTRMGDYEDLRPLATGAGRYNLAMAYKGARRYEEALTAYEASIAEFRREDMSDSLRKALQNYAWVLCIMGNPERAAIALTDADELIADAGARWQQELGLAFVEAVSGQKSEALTRCGRITSDLWAPPMDVVSHAYWIAGRVTLELRQIDAAEVLQKAALEWALRADSDTRCLQDANDLQRSIHQARKSKQTEGA